MSSLGLTLFFFNFSGPKLKTGTETFRIKGFKSSLCKQRNFFHKIRGKAKMCLKNILPSPLPLLLLYTHNIDSVFLSLTMRFFYLLRFLSWDAHLQWVSLKKILSLITEQFSKDNDFCWKLDQSPKGQDYIIETYVLCRIFSILPKNQINKKLSAHSLIFYLCFFNTSSISTSLADFISLLQAAETATLIQSYPK